MKIIAHKQTRLDLVHKNLSPLLKHVLGKIYHNIVVVVPKFLKEYNKFYLKAID